MSEAELVARIEAFLADHGARLIGLTPDSVGVQGDARIVGPGVVIAVPPAMTPGDRQELATRMINHVRGITRVLIEVQCSSR